MHPGIDVPSAAQLFAQVLPFELLLTNLGKLSVQFDTDSLRLKALWGPALLTGFENEQTVGVTTTNDSLCLLHTTFTPIPSLLSRAAEILQRACERHVDRSEMSNDGTRPDQSQAIETTGSNLPLEYMDAKP